MGTKAAVLVAKALQASPGALSTLKSFSCNFNEVESAKASRLILDTLLSDAFLALETVEYKGNTLGRKAALEYIGKFEAKGRILVIFEDEEEEEDEDDEGEEDEDDDEAFVEEDIVKKLEKLSL
jgi:Ran GTPase-activating protein (RanGAP) involved in mRNA processing and transport